MRQAVPQYCVALHLPGTSRRAVSFRGATTGCFRDPKKVFGIVLWHCSGCSASYQEKADLHFVPATMQPKDTLPPEKREGRGGPGARSVGPMSPFDLVAMALAHQHAFQGPSSLGEATVAPRKQIRRNVSIFSIAVFPACCAPAGRGLGRRPARPTPAGSTSHAW